MIAIAAVDENWAIGNKGNLLISIPEDQRGVFRFYTAGNTVVYGRKTLQTFKGEKVLPKRKNIILSRNPEFTKEGALVLHSTEELDEYAKVHPEEEIFVIGGEEIYKTLITICDKCIITKIAREFEADAYFPNLDESDEWELCKEEEPIESEVGVTFHVCHYKRLCK